MKNLSFSKTKNKIFVFFWSIQIKYSLKHCNEMQKFWYLATPPLDRPFWSGLTVHIIFIECLFASFGDSHHWSCGIFIYFTLSAGNWQGRKPLLILLSPRNTHTHWPVLYRSMASFWPTDKSWAGLESDWMSLVNSSLSTHKHTHIQKQTETWKQRLDWLDEVCWAVQWQPKRK